MRKRGLLSGMLFRGRRIFGAALFVLAAGTATGALAQGRRPPPRAPAARFAIPGSAESASTGKKSDAAKDPKKK
ncbi:MAG TPA: hypothetical protein VJT73_04310, partial [Polyangiaceae bacterium]|nr:hypothetical protein [Polyangiaceae bacterium]